MKRLSTAPCGPSCLSSFASLQLATLRSNASLHYARASHLSPIIHSRNSSGISAASSSISQDKSDVPSNQRRAAADGSRLWNKPTRSPDGPDDATLSTIISHFASENPLNGRTSRPKATKKSTPTKRPRARAARAAQYQSRKAEQLPPCDEVSQEILENNKDAYYQVYNYAARFNCIPNVSTEWYNRRSYKTRRWRVMMEMPEHNIVAEGVHRDRDTARIIAASKFKTAAEEFHVSTGLAIDDAVLSTDTNVTDFVRFLQVHGAHAKVEVDVEKSFIDGAEAEMKATVTVNGVPVPQTVLGARKSRVETLGRLIGAVTLAQSRPDLLAKFRKTLQDGKGRFLERRTVISEPLRTAELDLMWNLAERGKHLIFGQEDPVPAPIDSSQHEAPRKRSKPTQDYLSSKSGALKRRLQRFEANPALEQLRRARSDLPMSQFSNEVVDQVDKHIYSIIVGATGSGKTTQVPQILLDNAILRDGGAGCNIVCTQPRRIAATSVARRVAQERGEPLQKTVGYHVRFDARYPEPHGSILYCTTGILLQRLQHNPDEVYDEVSYLVIDEVHERDMIIDFLMIVIKKTLAERAQQGKKLPHVVFMSATMDTERFSAYFQDSLPADLAKSCPTLSVPGRTFPVENHFLDDVLNQLNTQYASTKLSALDFDRAFLESEQSFQSQMQKNQEREDDAVPVINWDRTAEAERRENKDSALVSINLVAITVAHIASTTNEGAILIFLPGLDDIQAVETRLLDDRPLDIDFTNEEQFRIYKLHSTIPDQRTVFDPVPAGCRKIILSTNIAETSVTIPDVQFVVDTGKSRQKGYDQLSRITSLRCDWISRSNARQRAGRAGRVQNGHYYALYTCHRHEAMAPSGTPELLRTDLQETCLDVAAQKFDQPIADFLAAAMDPPASRDVQVALRALIDLGALTDKELPTPLGTVLASLPIHPTLGKMIVLAIIFRCVDPIIILGAAASERPLFLRPLDVPREQYTQRFYAGDTQSDHLGILAAFQDLRSRSYTTEISPQLRSFANEQLLHVGAFTAIRSTTWQIEKILVESGLIEPPSTEIEADSRRRVGGDTLNQNSDNPELVKAILLAGLEANIALHTRGATCRTAKLQGTRITISSVNAELLRIAKQENYKGTLFAYDSVVLSKDGTSHSLWGTTAVTPLMVLLFGKRPTSDMIVDGWLRVRPVNGDDPTDRYGAQDTVLRFRSVMDALLNRAFGNLAALSSAFEEGSMYDSLVNVVATVVSKPTTGKSPPPRGPDTRLDVAYSPWVDGNGFFPRGIGQSGRGRVSYTARKAWR